MTSNIVKITEERTENRGKKVQKRLGGNFFLGKFKENSDFSLNSGNFYVTLQPELCPLDCFAFAENDILNGNIKK